MTSAVFFYASSSMTKIRLETSFLISPWTFLNTALFSSFVTSTRENTDCIVAEVFWSCDSLHTAGRQLTSCEDKHPTAGEVKAALPPLVRTSQECSTSTGTRVCHFQNKMFYTRKMNPFISFSTARHQVAQWLGTTALGYLQRNWSNVSMSRKRCPFPSVSMRASLCFGDIVGSAARACE